MHPPNPDMRPLTWGSQQRIRNISGYGYTVNLPGSAVETSGILGCLRPKELHLSPIGPVEIVLLDDLAPGTDRHQTPIQQN